MTELILSNITASITELKTNPMKTVETASGEAIAILNRNKPAFYCLYKIHFTQEQIAGLSFTAGFG